VYMDGSDAPEIPRAAEACRVVGAPGEMQLALQEARARAEVACAEVKGHARQLQRERTGGSLDGQAGAIRAPIDGAVGLARYPLHAFGRHYCPWPFALALVGRAVAAAEVRRPLFSRPGAVRELSTK
ncbi:unnamed protein product, partial [Prorocentrum cordatum]